MASVSQIFGSQWNDEFQRDFDDGYIREQWHPTLPLRIFNYTEKAVFNQHWTNATLACRGLIIDLSGNVVSRPFPKFFNHGEDADPYEHLDFPGEPPFIMDKLDGSLGIGYQYHGEWAIATRGSFTSEQALHATDVLRKKHPHFQWLSSKTPLFEIIYPENRIVLDYSGQDDLVYLGYMDNLSGHFYPSLFDPMFTYPWDGPRAERLSAIDLTRENREGVVVYHAASNTLEKYKQEDYLALHKLVTNLNARTIYDAMEARGPVHELVAPYPDEFHTWIKSVYSKLMAQWVHLQQDVFHAYETVVQNLNEDFGSIWERREFALSAKQYYPGITAELFMLLDGQNKRMADSTWRKLRPSVDWRP